MSIKFDDQGREIPDPRPMALFAGKVQPESLQSMMQRMIRETFSRLAVQEGEESFEEANDFDLEEDDFDDQLTKYEEMGVEHDTARESEEGPPLGGDTGQAEPAGLRSVGAGSASGPGDSETDHVDGGPGVDQDPPVPASAGKTNVVPGAGKPPLHRPGKRAPG